MSRPAPHIEVTDTFTTVTFRDYEFPPPRGAIINLFDSVVGLKGARKVIQNDGAHTLTVRDLTRLENALLAVYGWIDKREGESVRFGLMLVLGYRESGIKPWWSPSRLIHALVEWM